MNLQKIFGKEIEASTAVETVTGPMGDHTGQTEENITTEKIEYENYSFLYSFISS